MTEPGDIELIKSAQAGDARAFASLVERHYASIFRVAFKWCGNREDAEDIAQEVAVKLARAIKGFKAKAAFSTWLYRVTLNAVRDFQRARARHDGRVAAFAFVAEAEYPAHQEADVMESQLMAAVRALPDKQRDAVLLTFAEGLNHRQAGKIMGCAEATVSWHIHEAKKRLSQLLEG